MAIQYSGGAIVNNATVCNNKADLCAAIDTGLQAAGWTVTTHTSSTDNIYESALTPAGNQIKVRVWDNGVNCVNLRMMNTAETISQSNACYLYVTTSTTYTVIACKYQFAIFVPGSVSSRNFVIASALYIPPFLVTLGLTTSAFIMGNGNSDTDTSNTTGSFRTSLTSRGSATFTPAQGWNLLNATTMEYNGLTDNTNANIGLPALATFQSAAIDGIAGYRWHDNSAMIVEPLIAWGTPTITTEAKLRGQLWNSFVATESYPADLTTSVDSHTYYNLTQSNNGTTTLPASMRGCLFVTVT